MTSLTLQAPVPARNGRGLSASTLKIIGCIFMVIDHIGVILLPDLLILRIIGRLSYPFFAYFIAEGCRYTRNKLKRFLLVLGLAVLCEGVYFIMMDELDGGILVNFCLSILLIYQVQAIKKALAQKNFVKVGLFLRLRGTRALGGLWILGCPHPRVGGTARLQGGGSTCLLQGFVQSPRKAFVLYSGSAMPLHIPRIV